MINEQLPKKHYPSSDYTSLEIFDILKELQRATDYFPHRAINAAIAKQEEITPALVEVLKSAIKYYAILPFEKMDLIFSLYLLSKFREKAAFPVMLELASIPEDYLENILGIWFYSSSFAQFFASTYDGDLTALKAFMENDKVSIYFQDYAMQSLMVLFKNEVLSREEVIYYFKSLFNSHLRHDAYGLGSLIYNSTKMYPEEVLGEIEKAFQEHWIDPQYITLEYVKQVMELGKETCLKQFVYEDDYLCSIDDIKKELGLVTGALPDSPFKTGRNDPCPCYSGKKFKKCCGN